MFEPTTENSSRAGPVNRGHVAFVERLNHDSSEILSSRSIAESKKPCSLALLSVVDVARDEASRRRPHLISHCVGDLRSVAPGEEFWAIEVQLEHDIDWKVSLVTKVGSDKTFVLVSRIAVEGGVVDLTSGGGAERSK